LRGGEDLFADWGLNADEEVHRPAMRAAGVAARLPPPLRSEVNERTT
jgi:hypothetical protein